MSSAHRNAFVSSAKKDAHINQKQREHQINSRVKTIDKVPSIRKQSNNTNVQSEKKFGTKPQNKVLKYIPRENSKSDRASNLPLVRRNIQLSGKVKSSEAPDDTSLIRMDTIKEEEFKDEYISATMKCKNSKGNVHNVPESGDIHSMDKKSVTEDSNLTVPNMKELRQLEEIEKDFVAFLLPWLKLVPSSSRERGSKITKEQRDLEMEGKNKRRLDNYLSNLSKVCDKNSSLRGFKNNKIVVYI